MKALLLFILTFFFATTIVFGAAFGSVDEVDTANGIDQSEALLIAEAYFFNHISGCGYPVEPTSVGYYWVSKTRIGISGQPGPPIYIKKKSGNITWKDQATTLEALKKTEPNDPLNRNE